MTEMEFAWIIFGAQILLPAIMAMCAALFCHPEPESAWFFLDGRCLWRGSGHVGLR